MSGTSSKRAALQELAVLGLESPPSFVANAKSVSQLPRWLEKHICQHEWYIRCFEKRHSGLAPSRVETLKRTRFLLERSQTDEITLTAFVPARYSGVAMIRANVLLLEFVPGALETLLTLGASPGCFIYLRRSNATYYHAAPAGSYAAWKDGELKGQVYPNKEFLPEEILCSLITSLSSVPVPRIFEWVADSEGTVYFLDVKTPPAGFLSDPTKLIANAALDNRFSMSRPMQGIVSRRSLPGNTLLLVPSSCLIKYCDTVGHAAAAVLKRGALLSHLSLRAAIRNVPVLISPLAYRILSSREGETATIEQSDLLSIEYRLSSNEA